MKQEEAQLIGPINSLGGPYIILSKSNAHAWKGFEFEKDSTYEKVCMLQCPEGGKIVSILESNDALVLGTPDTLYFLLSDDGGMFIRLISYEFDDHAETLINLIAQAPQDQFSLLTN